MSERPTPDVVELLRRNEEAKRRACPHARQRLVFRDFGYPVYNVCMDCGEDGLPPSGPEWERLRMEIYKI